MVTPPLPGDEQGSTWAALDRIVVTSVVWEDGAVDGDREPLLHETALARSRAAQLASLLRTLRLPRTGVAKLRAAFALLDRSDYALERLRGEALRELTTLAPAAASAVSAWREAKIAELAAWQARCERVAAAQPPV